MPIVVCKACKAKNRLARYRITARAQCGICRNDLPEPTWVGAARQAHRYWPYVVAFLTLVFLAFFAAPDRGPTRTTRAETGWAPPAFPAPTPPRFESVATASTAQHAAPPPMPCVPVNVASGSSRLYTHHPALAPLKVSTPPGQNYVLKLVTTGTHRLVMSAYVAGGDTQTFQVPLGRYSIYYAAGKIWCGEKDAFGRGNTRLARLSTEFAFTKEIDGYAGNAIELTPRSAGNLQIATVSDDEFEQLVPDGIDINHRDKDTR